jgi:hypothetical protein
MANVSSELIRSRAAVMWSITSTELELAREELKSRRAAMETKYTRDIEDLDADLAEIETFERAATAFAVKQKAEAAEVAMMPDTEVGSEPKPVFEMPPGLARGTDRAGKLGEASRWRLSLGDRSATTQP